METINSYKLDGKIDEKTLLCHIDWLKTLPLYKEYKDLKINNRTLVVSHSHVYNTWDYRNYSTYSSEYKTFVKTVLFSRFKNFDNSDIFNVFGHTPTQNVLVQNHKASIDLGCVYNDSNLDGKLCALAFPSMKLITASNIE